jgi:nitronate monooxygenase
VLDAPVREPRLKNFLEAGSLDLRLFDVAGIVRVNLWLLIGPWRGVIAHRFTVPPTIEPARPGPRGSNWLAVQEDADLIVAQGTEAGGHGARRGWSTLAFVPAVVDLAGPVPVLAAGGIADGRGVAAALALGAAGALIGTRFLTTAEALADPDAKKAIVDGNGEDTERSSVLDIARGSRWPLEYTGRTLGHPFLDRWRDAEAELAADPDDTRREYREGIARGELPAEPVWASQAIGLIHDLPPAAELVGVLAAQAEEALARAGRR